MQWFRPTNYYTSEISSRTEKCCPTSHISIYACCKHKGERNKTIFFPTIQKKIAWLVGNYWQTRNPRFSLSTSLPFAQWCNVNMDDRPQGSSGAFCLEALSYKPWVWWHLLQMLRNLHVSYHCQLKNPDERYSLCSLHAQSNSPQRIYSAVNIANPRMTEEEKF